MTNLLDAFGTYLPTQITVSKYGTTQGLVLGQNLFLGRLPAEAPNSAVLIQQYAAGAPTFTMGTAVFALENPRIQIQVRGEPEDYPGTWSWTRAIQYAMGAFTSITTLDGLTILRAEPTSAPNPLPYDDANRPKFTINFQVTVAPY